jgi:hypothetical protein
MTIDPAGAQEERPGQQRRPNSSLVAVRRRNQVTSTRFQREPPPLRSWAKAKAVSSVMQGLMIRLQVAHPWKGSTSPLTMREGQLRVTQRRFPKLHVPVHLQAGAAILSRFSHIQERMPSRVRPVLCSTIFLALLSTGSAQSLAPRGCQCLDSGATCQADI